MEPLSQQDIESELSYAYLHAVVSRAGMSCQVTNRHQDNRGIDATITAWPSPEIGGNAEVDFKVQLKATIQDMLIRDGQISYFIREVKRYDDLRLENITSPRFLVVLFLPRDPTQWLIHSREELLMRRCAYWVSLKGAPPSSNDTGQTVYLPENQPFSPESITELANRLSVEDFPRYTQQ